MTPAVRALAAALLGALFALPLVSSPAHAADADQPLFVGHFAQRAQPGFNGETQVYRYQVTIERVYGEVAITSRRVTVRSTDELDKCPAAGVGQGSASQGSAGQGSAGQEQASPSATPTSGGALQELAPGATENPTSPTTTPTEPSTTAPTTPSEPSTTPSLGVDGRSRFFKAVRDGNDYVVTCADVRLVDSAVKAEILEQLGEGRAPGTIETPAVPLDEVDYLCPDTSEAIDLGDRASCETLADNQSFDRAAAPGLALVIVGVLGLLLARRMGRARRVA